MKTRKRQSTVASELQQDFDSIMHQLEKIQRELGTLEDWLGDFAVNWVSPEYPEPCRHCGSVANHPKEAPDVCPVYENATA